MQIKEYTDTEGHRRWEMLFEDVCLVLLTDSAGKPYSSQLLAFDGFGKLIWSVLPNTNLEQDYIVDVWVKDCELYAGSFSGYEYKINYKTGCVLATKFTR